MMRVIILTGLLLGTALPLSAGIYATQIVSYGQGASPQLSFTNASLALGGPRGAGTNSGSLHVLNLGEGGSLTLGFDSGFGIYNGPGKDFTVFENPFTTGSTNAINGELLFVEVSSDGIIFARFDSRSTNAGPISAFGTLNPYNVSGLAGKTPVYANVDGNSIDPFDPSVSGGDAFDLDGLTNHASVISGDVDLNFIRYVRLADIKGDGSVLDSFGNAIYDQTGSIGFGQLASADIDALAVIHVIPEPTTCFLMALGLALVLRASPLFPVGKTNNDHKES